MASAGTAEVCDAAPSSVKAVILVGGPKNGHRFRPLSTKIAKPLFPIGGIEMIAHHISACSKLSELFEILLLGSYEEGVFSAFVHQHTISSNKCIRYLEEKADFGTAGGLVEFKNEILEGSPKHIIVMHCDICCSFPLAQMLNFHIQRYDSSSAPNKAEAGNGPSCTLMGTNVSHDEVTKYGCLVADPRTCEILHWAEKPDTYVSNTVNCGIYILSADMIGRIYEIGKRRRCEKRLSHAMDGVAPPNAPQALQGSTHNEDEAASMPQPPSPHVTGSGWAIWNGIDSLSLNSISTPPAILDIAEDRSRVLQLEKDVLIPLAGKREIYLYNAPSFWHQIKTPGMALKCCGMYLNHLKANPDDTILAVAGAKNSPTIVGNVVIHPSANVHPSCKVGPNVTIGANAKIKMGVRIADSIILEGVIIHEHACIVNSIIGWNSLVGKWARIQGSPPSSKSGNARRNQMLSKDITILGAEVQVKPECVILNSIVLENKTLSRSYHNDILL